MFINENYINNSILNVLQENFELNKEFNETKIKFIKLEHVAITTNNISLLEEGNEGFFEKLINIVKKIIEGILNIIRRFKEFLQSIISRIISLFSKKGKEYHELTKGRSRDSLTVKCVSVDNIKKFTQIKDFTRGIESMIKDNNNILSSNLVIFMNSDFYETAKKNLDDRIAEDEKNEEKYFEEKETFIDYSIYKKTLDLSGEYLSDLKNVKNSINKLEESIKKVKVHVSKIKSDEDSKLSKSISAYKSLLDSQLKFSTVSLRQVMKVSSSITKIMSCVQGKSSQEEE